MWHHEWRQACEERREEDGKLVCPAARRLCLFGEHQDYLGLPVIATAISLFIKMEAEKRDDKLVVVNMPDIGETETIDLNAPIVYERPRQYLRSGLKVVRDLGYDLPHGLTVTVRGDIPINAGTASSSAFVIAWLKLLLEVCQAPKPMTQKLWLGWVTRLRC